MKHLILSIIFIFSFKAYSQTVSITFGVEHITSESKKKITVYLTADGDFTAADGTDDWNEQTITIGFADDVGIVALQPNPNVTDLTSGFFTYQNRIGVVGSDIYTYVPSDIGGSPDDGKVYMTLTSPGAVDKPLADGVTVIAFSFKVPDSYGTITNDDVFLLEDNLSQSSFVIEPSVTNVGTGTNVWDNTGFQTALPITLKSFTATKQAERSVLLDWESLTEINASHYEVQRLNVYSEWESLYSISAVGSISTSAEYSYLDTEIDLKSVSDSDISEDYIGVNYRLKLVDLDGSFEYSEIEEVSLREYIDELTVYPNPTVDEVYVTIANVHELDATLTIVDSKGTIYLSKKLENGNKERVSTANMPAGLYIFTIRQGDLSYSEKVVKLD